MAFHSWVCHAPTLHGCVLRMGSLIALCAENLAPSIVTILGRMQLRPLLHQHYKVVVGIRITAGPTNSSKFESLSTMTVDVHRLLNFEGFDLHLRFGAQIRIVYLEIQNSYSRYPKMTTEAFSYAIFVWSNHLKCNINKNSKVHQITSQYGVIKY